MRKLGELCEIRVEERMVVLQSISLLPHPVDDVDQLVLALGVLAAQRGLVLVEFFQFVRDFGGEVKIDI